MNKCFNEFTLNDRRRYVSPYYDGERETDTFGSIRERALDVCENIVAFFERPTVRLAVRLASLTAAAVGFLLLVAAVEAGSVGLASGVCSALAIVAATALAMRI